MFPSLDPLLAFRHALRRSRIRLEILLVLLEHGRLTLPDLARLVGAYPNNVLGAILGDDDNERYRVDGSLAVLGLVDLVELDGAVAYELTPLGQAVARRLTAEVDRRRGPRPRLRT